MYTVLSDNQYYYVACDKTFIKKFKTHREAWRECDKMNGEPVNKQEDTADWIFEKMSNPE